MQLNAKISATEATTQLAGPRTAAAPRAPLPPAGGAPQQPSRRSWADVVRTQTADSTKAAHQLPGPAARKGAGKDDDEETRADCASTLTDSEGSSDSEALDSPPPTKAQAMSASAPSFTPGCGWSLAAEAQVWASPQAPAQAAGQVRLRSAAAMFVPSTSAAKVPVAPPPGLQTPLRSSAVAFMPMTAGWRTW
uniref:Uncharacterized protein n=1 Tax=Alexandrium catenella TaxID=2925 RepID=A0A7S1M168_ALECA|mmetsp:Transcript_17852/g.48577  ORF Transcript_17852/g.48577 Transcript_17852/m.48577 type:complete len:193 (+) Transcript_17852:75-653(+)